jgi:hypothetical protein
LFCNTTSRNSDYDVRDINLVLVTTMAPSSSNYDGPAQFHDTDSFNGDLIAVAEVKKVTHNDPTLDAEA